MGQPWVVFGSSMDPLGHMGNRGHIKRIPAKAVPGYSWPVPSRPTNGPGGRGVIPTLPAADVDGSIYRKGRLSTMVYKFNTND